MGYLLAALVGGVLFFNSQATPKRAAHVMEDALRRQYPGTQINVQVEGKRGLNVIHGKFKTVRLQMSGGSGNGLSVLPIAAVAKAKNTGRIGQMALQLHDFQLEGLQIESADITWSDVVYDFDALRKTNKLNLLQTGPANAHVVVPASSLQTLIAQRVKDIQSPKLTLQNGRVIITGTRPAPIFGTPLPFTMSARPIVKNGTQIWLSDPQASISGVNLPATMVNNLAQGFNPVYTFTVGEKWPFAMNITRLNAQNDKLELFADLTFIPAAATATPQSTPQVTPTPIPTPTPLPTPSATPSMAASPA